MGDGPNELTNIHITPSQGSALYYGICVQPNGLIIHPEHHWLAASHDGLLSDPASPDLIEFKNPYKLAVRDTAKSKEAQTHPSVGP